MLFSYQGLLESSLGSKASFEQNTRYSGSNPRDGVLEPFYSPKTLSHLGPLFSLFYGPWISAYYTLMIAPNSSSSGGGGALGCLDCVLFYFL